MITKFYNNHPFRSDKIFSSFIAALILGTLEITFVLAYAALIFPSDISDHFNQGISILLLGTVICFVVLALFSSYAGCIGSAQDIPASISAVMAISIIAALGTKVNTYILFSTVIAAMALASLITAVFLLVMGFTGLGKAIRFIPYPVIGGLLISTGWILSEAGLGMMPSQWIIGASFAISLLVVRKYFSSPWVLPAFLLSAIILLNLYLVTLGISIEDARSQGFLLDVNLNKIPLVFSPNSILGAADWSIVIKQLPTIISLCLITCVVVLIQISSIEVIVKQELKPRHELYATGFANMLVAFCCGLISYHHISSTTLAYNMGAQTRLVGVLTAAICTLVFFTDTSWMEYLPLPILGGLILYLGLEFIYEWLFLAYRKMPKSEYLIMLLIVACAIFINFPTAIILGMISGIVLFTFQYNSIGAVKSIVSENLCRSSVMRSASEENYLLAQNSPIVAFKLSGILYFGTANDLHEQTKNFINHSVSGPPKFLILDFKEITNIDSTALMNLMRTHEYLEKNNIGLIFSANTGEQMNMIKTFYAKNTLSQKLFFSHTLDHAIEECENRILKSANLNDNEQLDSLEAILQEEGWDDSSINQFRPYLEQNVLYNQQKLIRTGEHKNDIYLVTSGKVSIMSGNPPKRLRVLKPGMIIGEMSLYTGLPRTANVIANGTATVYKLSSSQLNNLQDEKPTLAIKLHKFLAKQMAQRLIDETRLQSIRNS